MKRINGLPWVGVLAITVAGGILPAAQAVDLEQQLDIQPFNGTQSQARDVADQWMQVGNQAAAAGHYDRAIAAWAEAIKIYDRLGDKVAEGIAYDYMGLTYANLGNYLEAEALLRRRLAIARDTRDLAGVVYGLNNLGNILVQNGRVLPAKAAFEEALLIAQEIPLAGGIGASLSGLGVIATLEGNSQDAAKYFEAATAYRFRAGDSIGLANSSNNLGDAYRALNRDQEAIGAYRVGLRTGQDLDNRPMQLRALDGLIGIYLDQEDFWNVRYYLDQRIALTLPSPQPNLQAVLTLMWLGKYYEGTGELDTARQTYGQALAMAQAIEAQAQTTELTNRLISLSH